MKWITGLRTHHYQAFQNYDNNTDLKENYISIGDSISTKCWLIQPLTNQCIANSLVSYCNTEMGKPGITIQMFEVVKEFQSISLGSYWHDKVIHVICDGLSIITQSGMNTLHIAYICNSGLFQFFEQKGYCCTSGLDEKWKDVSIVKGYEVPVFPLKSPANEKSDCGFSSNVMATERSTTWMNHENCLFLIHNESQDVLQYNF